MSIASSLTPRRCRVSLTFLLAAISVASCTSTQPPPDEQTGAWYVRASPAGDPAASPGSADNPFSTLAQVEEHAQEGDTIIVLASPDGTPLTGPIQLLPGQTLRGDESGTIRLGGEDLYVMAADGTGTPTRLDEDGPDEVHCVVEGTLPRISSPTGHAVLLADNSTVSGLHLADVAQSGIFGLNTSGVTVENNLIEGFNPEASGGDPAVRDELLEGNLAFFAALAGIHLSAHNSAVLEPSVIRGNCVRQGAMGISLNLVDDARAAFVVEDNIVTDIQSQLGSAVQLTATDDTYAELTIERLFTDRLGFADGTSNNDKILVTLAERSTVDLAIHELTARNSTGVGGPSSTGIELFLSGEVTPRSPQEKAPVLNAVIDGADIRGMPSAGIQLADGASNSQVSLVVRNSTVVGTSGAQGQSISLVKTPIGDSAARGGRHTIVLEGNELRAASDGRNNVFVLVNVDRSLDSLDFTANNNVMAGATGDGLHVQINGSVTELSVSGADNDILDAAGYGVWIGGGGNVETENVSFGGAGEGDGGNRVVGSGVAEAFIDDLAVTGEGNWWGDANGPRVEKANGGALDVEPFLTSDPRPGPIE